MTHPFALSIDDLACLELADQTAPIEGGTVGKKYTGPGCILTAGYDSENGNHPGVTFKTHEGGITFTDNHEGGGFPPYVSTNVYPENGGPVHPYILA